VTLKKSLNILTLARARYYSIALLFVFWSPVTAADLTISDVKQDLVSSKTSNRYQAAELILYHRAKIPTSDINHAIQTESNPQVRYRLMQSLAAQEGTAAVPTLISGLSDPNVVVRSVAARELGRIDGGIIGRKALISCFEHDSDADVRQSCVVSLGFYHGRPVLDALAHAAVDLDVRLRLGAVVALSLQHNREADVILLRLAHDLDHTVAAKAQAVRSGK